MTRLSTMLCAMTFQGNASNGLQQDAFFFVDDYYQEALGITPVRQCDDAFCVAVSDGVAESNLSQYASLKTVKTVKQLWQNYLDNSNQSPVMDISKIYEKVATLPKRFYGASATLALVYRTFAKDNQTNSSVVIKHIGDSRVYHFSAMTKTWRCITRDHNLLNQLVDEQAAAENRQADFSEYNQDGMASPMYALTDCLIADSDLENNPMPAFENQTLAVSSDDCLVVCTDGVHDLVPCDKWQSIDKHTDLQAWLKQLRKQIYAAKGRAYDNATAILVRFDAR
ncbi:PP2C family protein-serine/threonine phosphatase [Moraxella osloensis]|uniref:PP2C family protein-serine/threonine phosphatase n=1 Tax=Faucicola osloensis TaxID=34062 RepID=UPI0020063E1C|nr:protein phosphatase 2C domain-containing protein [Moraxella osloensis]MCK6053083.1 protein phosphatase 2C domain-containing protein [Moraxella osloensis]